MLTPMQRRRFHELRDRQDTAEPLTAQEQGELEGYLRQWDEAEAALLAPSLRSQRCVRS